MPKKLTATFEGLVFSRKTDRTYTHVLIGRSLDGIPGDPWEALSWAGSLALANKKLASSEFRRYGELKIIPVDQEAI